MHDVNRLRQRYVDGTVKTEAGNDISLEELNFQKRVIGSDEAGTVEAFKPSVTAAAYVGPENIEKLIELGVRDSKAYAESYGKRAKEIVYSLGEKLTGFTSYKDFEGKEGKVIRSDYVTFAVSVMLNSQYNTDFKHIPGEKSGNRRELLRHGHKAALLALAKEAPYDYMVVDDFQGGGDHDKILKELAIQPEQAVIAIKADGKVMAVACASVIAFYLTSLYVDEVDKLLESKYGINIPLDRGPRYNSEAFQAPLKALNRISKEAYEEFMETYAKKSTLKNMKLKE